MFSATTKDDLNNLKNSSQNTACDMKDDVQNIAHQAGRKVRNAFNIASDDVSHASDTVSKEIQRNPVRSTMIALGVGALIGALLRS